MYWKNVTNKAPDTDSSVTAFACALAVNLIIGCLAIIVFCLMRHRYKHVYLSNFVLNSTKLLSELSESQTQTLTKLKLSDSPISWLTPWFRISDEDLYDFAGFDVFVYLRFVRLCFKIFAVMLPYGLLVLIPLNTSGSANLQGMASITLGNVEQKSTILWAHFLGVWIYSIFTYFLLYKEWVTFTHYRQIYLRKGYEEQFSILISDLPTKLQNDRNLKEFMDDVFPDKVVSVHVFNNLTKWLEMIETHDDVLRAYEHAQGILSKDDCRPTHKKFIFAGEKFDSIAFYENKLKETNDAMVVEQGKAHVPLSMAVVTFRSLQDTAIGLQTTWNCSPYTMFLTAAPATTDLIWDNLKLSSFVKMVRYPIIHVALFFLVCFWSTPVLIVSSMVSMEALKKHFPFLEGVKDLPLLIKGFIEGFLASLVLEVFFYILPRLLAFMSRLEGINCRSQVAISCIGKTFIFQIVNKFLGVLFGGALLSRLDDITESPAQIPRILAESMPSMAKFFINILMLRSLTGFPMEMLQSFRLIKVCIKRKWFCKSSREETESWKPPPITYPGLFSVNLFMFIIGIAYSVLSPLVIIFVLLYFGMAYICRFYSLVYVRRSSYQSGGLMWPKVFNRMIVGIVVFQLLMIGVFALKEHPLISSLCLPLPVVTFLFLRYIHKYFARSTIYLNLSMAGEMTMPPQSFLETSSQKYNRALFLPDMFALSTDKAPEGEESLDKCSLGSKPNSVDVEMDDVIVSETAEHECHEHRV